MSFASLGTLRGFESLPLYREQADAAAWKTGIVHVGVGAFHRAHQSVFTDAVLRRGELRWGICGVGLMDFDRPLLDALRSQGGMYAVWERGPDADRGRVVGCHRDLVLACDSPEKAVAAIADADVKVITLAITEKGYCLEPGSYELEWGDLLQEDLDGLRAGAASARTAPGLLLSGLSVRRKAGAGGVTILSCDNLQENGKRIRASLLGLASRVSGDLAAWLEGAVAFPSSMVDRITPQATAEGRLEFAERFKVSDACTVICEDFLLWVIEDNFPYGRPEWESVAESLGGRCLVVPDVVPYELMKLRVLNGAHQALAYPACLLGHRAVDKALCDGRVLRFTRAYMEAAARTFAPPRGIDVGDWVGQTLRRFQNTRVQDQVLRLTEDGTNRIQVAIIDMVLENAAMTHIGALIIGAWAFYNGADEDETGAGIARLPDVRAAAVLPLILAACSEPGLGTCVPLLSSAFGPAAEVLAPPLADVLSARDGAGKASIAVALGRLWSDTR